MLEAGTFPSNRPQTAQQSYHVDRTQLAPRPMRAGNNSAAGTSALDVGGARATDTASKLVQPHGILSHSTSFQTQNNQLQVATSRSVNTPAPFLPAIDGYGLGSTKMDASSDRQRVSASLIEAAPTVPAPSTRPAAIDLYTPRPSTAPVRVSQHLSQVLPPKRELPFYPSNAVFAQSTEAAAFEGHGLQSITAGRQDCNDATVETIIPNSQGPEITVSKKAKSTTTTTSSKKQTTQARSKSTSKVATQTRSKKCDACK